MTHLQISTAARVNASRPEGDNLEAAPNVPIHNIAEAYESVHWWQRFAQTWRYDPSLAEADTASASKEAEQDTASAQRTPALGYARDSKSAMAADVRKAVARGSQLRTTVAKTYTGRVVEVDEDFFEAILYDSEEALEVTASIARGAVDDDDLELLVPGGIFYVAVGSFTTAGGRKTSTQTVRFRRLGRWSEDDRLHNEELARKWHDQFNFE
jgi:hypothetical protein